MSKRLKLNASSSSSEVDFVRLCEDIVQKIQEVLKRRKVLNKRYCQIMARKLSVKIACIREVVESCGRYKPAFGRLLAALHRYYEKAEVIVKQCGEEDWCAAAIFQGFNLFSFYRILRNINSVGVNIIERAKKYSAVSTTMESAFAPEFASQLYLNGYGDWEELMTRLEGVASERSKSSSRIFGFFLPDQAALKQHLARYLLKMIKFRSEYTNRNTLNRSSEPLKMILWEKDNEPAGTWGESIFIGAGSGASGVCKTSWLGVPCAKKVFHGEASETLFIKEALIMARLKHPCIVDFICCGNGEDKGDRFIAMELMEKSLFDLIEERKGVHFSLDVALDIIWQIVDGVEYLHKMGVAHRDLKPQNVVVKTLRSPYHEDYYCVKLVDFGTSKSEVEVSKSNTMSYRGVGTTRYRAPEVHPSAHPEGLGKVNWFKADAYSFAMTCAHVLTLTQPFEDLKSLSKLYTEILNGRRPILPSGCPEELVDLVKECWSTDWSKRPELYIIVERFEKIIFNNMLVPFSNLRNSMVSPKNNNVGMYDIKEEQGQIKEEGHTSFFTAQDVSLCNEVVSEERDSKFDVTLVRSCGIDEQELGQLANWPVPKGRFEGKS